VFALASSLGAHSCAVRGSLLSLRDAPGTDGTDAASDDGAPQDGGACGPAVVDPAGASALALGQSHSCRVDRGALLCWGANNDGALGTGDADDRRAPTAVSPAGGAPWIAVAAGDNSTCAIDATRAVWCWGPNAAGQLGASDTLSV
jgi:hypothetical protein